MSEWDPGISRAGHRRRYAGNDLERHTCCSEELGFFSASSKDERVAAFQTHDDLSRTRFVDEQLIDPLLSGRTFAGLLADIDELGVLRELQEVGMNQTVVGDDFGARENLGSPSRDQSGVAGSGPNEIDDAFGQGTQASPHPTTLVRTCFMRPPPVSAA